jgi:hypothetical protein
MCKPNSWARRGTVHLLCALMVCSILMMIRKDHEHLSTSRGQQENETAHRTHFTLDPHLHMTMSVYIWWVNDDQ